MSLPSARSITLVHPLKDVTVTAGETAIFECELSYEGIAVEWFLGGQRMEASDRVSLTTAAPASPVTRSTRRNRSQSFSSFLTKCFSLIKLLLHHKRRRKRNGMTEIKKVSVDPVKH